MIEYRRNEQQVLAGSITHDLRITEGGLLIQQKKIDLVNCDANLESIQIYL